PFESATGCKQSQVDSDLDGTCDPGLTFQTSLCCLAAPSGLASWWPGDGTHYDFIGTNHGILYGATFETGKVGEAFSFDGEDDYVDLGDWFDLQTFTIDMWVKAGASQALNAGILVNNLYTTDISWTILYANYGTEFRWNAQPCCAIFFNLTPDTWQHLAITVDAADHVNHVYLDGAEVPDSPVTAEGDITYDETRFLRMGYWGITGHFNGKIDELEIYDRALSLSEIQAIFIAGSTGKYKPDDDNDGAPNYLDNCLTEWNPMQEDGEEVCNGVRRRRGDGVGDACDICPEHCNPLQEPIRAGDANADCRVGLADIIFLANYFSGRGQAPSPSCRGNANGDDYSSTVADLIYLVRYILKGGPAPMKNGVCCYEGSLIRCPF
ncbi:MAG: hypothetical protein L0Y56_11895, partial [Nitrospira sp.]|nr:hypothetical protein [Nitrospira sp.]